MITALLTLFYTDYAGISVVTVGMVMLISRVFDGTSDVITSLLDKAGYLSSTGAAVTQPASAVAMIQNIYV